uniref:Uncharacterized protein n=1 Tax=Anguilla anguilla TaxID=7936 RepID=A0A0E9QG94_ANGAN
MARTYTIYLSFVFKTCCYLQYCIETCSINKYDLCIYRQKLHTNGFLIACMFYFVLFSYLLCFWINRGKR